MSDKTTSRRMGAIGVAAVLTLAIATPASASDVAVSGGSLAFTAAPAAGDFTAVTLSGAAQTTTAALDAFEVNDARGSGAGWNVTVQAGQMAEWDSTLNGGTGGFVASGKTLPTSSLTMSAPAVAADGTTSAAPSITAGPYTLDAGSAVKIASAATDAGMGKYDLAATTLTLAVPASAYAKTYRSTATVSLNTGP